jgi:hypothetical protein
MTPWKSKTLGITALLVSGCCVYASFAVANATYVDPGLYPRAGGIGLLLGVLAFPCLYLAWRFLDANGRTYVKVIALANSIQLLWTLFFTIPTPAP